MNAFAKERSDTFASHLPPSFLRFPRVRQNLVPVGWSKGWSMDRVHRVVVYVPVWGTVMAAGKQ